MIGVPDGRDQRAFAAAVQRQKAGFHIEVPGALRAVGIDAFQRALVGGEGELPEFLHLVDKDLIDAEFGDGQHVVLAALERFELGFDALLHALEALDRHAILRVDARLQFGEGGELVLDEAFFECGRRRR